MASSHRDEISRLELLHAAHPDGLVFPHLADAYRRAGRYAQAEGVLDAGLRVHSDYSSAHVVLGRLRLDQGKRAEGRAAFRRALQLDPQNQLALRYLGELAAEAGQLDEALEYYGRLQRLKSDGMVTDRIEEIRSRLASAEEPRRGSAQAGNGGGGTGAAGAAGPPRADREFRPEPGEVMTETMAELYARQGLHGRAAAVYRELLARNPHDDRLREKLRAVEASREAARGEERQARQDARRPAPEVGFREVTEPRWEPVTPPTPSSQQRTDPTIREYMATVLSWQPTGRRTREEEPEPEPWANAPVSTGAAAPEPGPVVPESRLARAPGAQPVSVPGPSPATNESAAVLVGITDMLVGLLEYRDPFFRGSSSLTRLLATSVGEELGLAEDDRVELALAAVLRDLGRLALGGRLVPLGRNVQGPDARRRIERHVDLSLHLLEGIRLSPTVRAAVRHHHERWDGKGYPDGLTGEDIPLPARILAVVDSFAAMVSPRTYRVPMKTPDAARELKEEAGTRYDPTVVQALLRVLGRRDQPHLGFVRRHHVLLVNPDPAAVVTAAKLCSVGYLAEVAQDLDTARERLRRVPVAALVLSAEIADDALPRFIRTLREDPLFATLPIMTVDADGVAWRVRLLESGADVCFPPEISHAELQGTLGALVRRTLRGSRGVTPAPDASPWLALQGDLQDFPLTWLLQVMKYDSRTAAIAIRAEREDGVIYLRKGDAVHAQLRSGARGEQALRHMLRWRKGRFTVQPDARPREVTIRSSIMHLLLTQAVDEDHAAAGIFGAVSAEG